MKANFISVWDDGVEIVTDCEVDPKTHEVFNIETANVDGLDICNSEHIEIDGVRFSVYDRSKYEIDDHDYWYD